MLTQIKKAILPCNNSQKLLFSLYERVLDKSKNTLQRDMFIFGAKSEQYSGIRYCTLFTLTAYFKNFCENWLQHFKEEWQAHRDSPATPSYEIFA